MYNNRLYQKGTIKFLALLVLLFTSNNYLLKFGIGSLNGKVLFKNALHLNTINYFIKI